MPVMDGIDSTRALKADNRTTHIPVIIVTSSAMEGDRRRIMGQSGCDDFFTKPINYNGLLDTIKNRIGE